MTDDRPWVFVDLDDTLFATRKKQPEPSGLEVAALDREGAPLSFTNPRQRALFRWLAQGAHLVPTTGRSTAALSRVQLPFDGWAICAFGGVVRRPDGRSDPRWRPQIEAAVATHAAALGALTERARALVAEAALDVRVRTERDDDLDLYLVLKHAHGDAAALATLEGPLRALLPSGFLLHRHDNNLAARPPYLDKAHAVAFLRREVVPPEALCVGLGDSLSDAPFLGVCDVAAVPTTSRLFGRLAPPEDE